MLYTEDTRIAALAVHIVGNKAKDEPLLVAPALSGQVGDTGLMQTLTAYFAGGFKSEEYYNLHHETDLACNEVYNFVCKVFDDRETFYDNSVGLARHLYETGTHPQIKGGEFYVVYFTGCRFGGEAVDAVGLFKSETRDTFLEVGGAGRAAAYLLLPGNQRRQTGQRVPRVQYRARRRLRRLRRGQHQPGGSALLDRRFPACPPAAGQLPQHAQRPGHVQEIRDRASSLGVRRVEGRPGRDAQRDDEILPGAGQFFRSTTFPKR